EQLVLLALFRLGNGAYGAAIRREIETRTGRRLLPSVVYVTLQRLEEKRLVCSYIGNPTPERGGRRRKHFLMDDEGQRAPASATCAGLTPFSQATSTTASATAKSASA